MTTVNLVSTSELLSKRSNDFFEEMFVSASEKVNEYLLDEIAAPRHRRMPLRFGGNEEHRQLTAKEYFKFVDMAVVQLQERFTQTDIPAYQKIENILLHFTSSASVLEKALEDLPSYPELDRSLLIPQLLMFQQMKRFHTVAQAVECFQSLETPVKLYLFQVKHLLQLLLVCPASSCEAERSFSALRRLKTWLRTTMSQTRLTAIAVGHIHQGLVSAIDVENIGSQFTQLNNRRLDIFGKWSSE